MDSFKSTEQRIAITCERYPEFPRQPVLVGRLIRHIHKLLLDQANGTLRRWDLNLPQYNALMMLYGTEGFTMNVSELAMATGEKIANVTRLANDLVKKELIERIHTMQDRRVVTLVLSARGLVRVKNMLPDVSALISTQLGSLNETEQQQLEALLKKMLTGIDALGDELD